MKRVLVIGGHGKVALLLAPLLVEKGIEVDSVIRNPDQSDAVRAVGGTPVVADVETLDVPGLTDLINGHDAVIWSAGAGGGNPERTYAVDRDAAIRTMDAAGAAGVRRFVMVSYFGAGPDHGVPEDNSFFHYAEAKAAADNYLRASDLDWTILQPSTLTLDPPTGKVTVGGEAGSVSRADVAAAIAASLDDPAWVRQSVPFNTGATPIDEVFDAVS